MARPKKYSQKALREAVGRYFDSISRIVPVTERIDSGRKDDKGHVIWDTVTVLNSLGEEAKRTEFLIPPSVGGLCAYLGIHRSTWAQWCDQKEYSAITTEASEKMQLWLEEQLLTRSGKDVRGIVFNLQNNYGYSEKKHLELGERAGRAVAAAAVMPMEEREKLLAEIAREFGGGGESSEE